MVEICGEGANGALECCVPYIATVTSDRSVGRSLLIRYMLAVRGAGAVPTGDGGLAHFLRCCLSSVRIPIKLYVENCQGANASALS